MAELVLLDLDNTLIKGQSQQLFLKYLFSKKIIKTFPFLKILLWFFLYKISLVKNPESIMNYAFSFLKNWPINDFQKLVNSFFEEKLKNVFYKEGLEIIREHQAAKRELLLISNAIMPIVRKTGEYLGIKHCIATELSEQNNRFTGEISGKIVYSKNKEYLIKDFAQKNSLTLQNSWAYSDHSSDLPMLELSTNPFAVNPNPELYKIALKRKWPILKFKKTEL